MCRITEPMLCCVLTNFLTMQHAPVSSRAACNIVSYRWKLLNVGVIPHTTLFICWHRLYTVFHFQRFVSLNVDVFSATAAWKKDDHCILIYSHFYPENFYCNRIFCKMMLTQRRINRSFINVYTAACNVSMNPVQIIGKFSRSVTSVIPVGQC